jgi:hypothetical protein
MQMQNGNNKQQQFCRGQLESARLDVWFRFRERREWEALGGSKGGPRPWSSVACVARIRGGRVVLASLACANPHVRTLMSHLAARSALCHRPSRSTASSLGCQMPSDLHYRRQPVRH